MTSSPFYSFTPSDRNCSAATFETFVTACGAMDGQMHASNVGWQLDCSREKLVYAACEHSFRWRNKNAQAHVVYFAWPIPPWELPCDALYHFMNRSRTDSFVKRAVSKQFEVRPIAQLILTFLLSSLPPCFALILFVDHLPASLPLALLLCLCFCTPALFRTLLCTLRLSTALVPSFEARY